MKELSMHILDIANNSVRAEASVITVAISEDLEGDRLEMTITDNGKGIPPEMLKSIRDPFTTSRTMRKVGLGIPFLHETCRACDGDLRIESTPGVGTTVTAWMRRSHIDRPPMGDLVSTMLTLFLTPGEIEFRYMHQIGKESFALSTLELKEVLGEVPLSDPQVYLWLKGYLQDSLEELGNA
ncbi:ATP-binding protein [Anaerotalea alkaliphila]|nr:ATP-binding protein [Anaerotalea alkaliphila]